MSERPHPLVELTRARILEFLREPEAVFWVFVFPVLLAFALGIAFRAKPPEKTRVAVLAGTAASARIVALLEGAAHLEVLAMPAAEAAEALRKGRVDVAVEVDGSAGGAPSVTYRFDPTRTESRAARLAVDDALQRALGRGDAATVREETVEESGSRYVDFLIPGLVGLNLMGSGMWGLGFSVVVARTRKLLKRFAATPMRRTDYLLSYALSRLLFLVLEVAAVVVFGVVAFDVAVRGSLVSLAAVALLGAAAFSGLGLLIAARTKTIEAASGWMNLVQLPMWLLSGSFFSYERFPEAVQPAIRALPLTALNDALRAVMNDGAPLLASWPELAVLLAWGGVSFLVAVKIFRWQ